MLTSASRRRRGGLCIQQTSSYIRLFIKSQDSHIFLFYLSDVLFFSLFIYFPLSGSPLDFFHTPPTTPSEAELTAMALSSAASSNKAQTPSPAGSSTTPSTTSPVADWTQKLAAPSEWAVISVDSITCSESNVSDAAARHGKAELSPGSPASPTPSKGSPAEQSWQERDSGLEPQAAAERAGEEMTLVLLSLMEHYRASLGLNPNTDVTTGAVGRSSIFTVFLKTL